MDSNEPRVVIKGMERVIERDLEKHKALLDKRRIELSAYREAHSYIVKRKKHYWKLYKDELENSYDKNALKRQVNEMANDLRKWEDKMKLARDGIDHETLIVDTLTKQLSDQYEGLEYLAQQKIKDNGNVE